MSHERANLFFPENTNPDPPSDRGEDKLQAPEPEMPELGVPEPEAPDLGVLIDGLYFLFDQSGMSDICEGAGDVGFVEFFAQNAVGQARGEDSHGWG